MRKIMHLATMFAVSIAIAQTPSRSYVDGLLVSESDPKMRVQIAPDFEYLGPETFLLGDTHEAERHHFVRRDGKDVTALLVLQFERILDGVPGKYEFEIPPEAYLAGSNYRFARDPIRLGSHDYVHNTWAFDTRKSARENPGKESDRTLRILSRNGYMLEKPTAVISWAMNMIYNVFCQRMEKDLIRWFSAMCGRS